MLIISTISTAFANTTNQPLSEVIEELGEKYQVFFTYDAEKLSKVEVDFSINLGESLNQAVGRLLSSTNYIYETFGDKYYVICEKGKAGRKKARKISRHLKEIQRLEKDGVNLKRINRNTERQLEEVIQAVFVPENQPEVSISGTITDGDGEPLIGATILLKGTSDGTSTDLNGNYSLTVPDQGAVLLFSYTGYATQEIAVGSQSVIDIQMVADAELLTEVVVIGYGEVNARDLTGAVGSVRALDIVRSNPVLSCSTAGPNSRN